MSRIPLAGLANMLGLGAQGYGQDVTTNLQRQRQAQQDQQTAAKFASDQQYQQAQIGNFASEAAKRAADTENTKVLTAGKLAANKKAFGMIARMNPDHPMVVGGFDPDTDYTEEAKGVVGAWRDAQKPKPPQNPIVGSDEWKTAERFRASLRPKPEGPAPQIVSAATPNADGTPGTPTYFRVPKGSGPATAIEGITPKPSGGGIGRAGIQKAIASNTEKLSVLDDALKELDQRPEAVGLTRGIPLIGDALNQRVDPEGVAARAQIGNIGSMIIHDRSGAAVTVHEMPRLAPFVPSVTDTPETIRIKLKKLRAAIEVETGALQQSPSPAQGGGRAGGGGTSAVTEEAWAAKNPPKTGESFDQYHARFLSSAGAP